MPRSIWKGAVTFGLVTIPIRMYGATEEKDISFRQVHDADGGRIRYKRVCDVCGEEVPYEHIAKGYESADGRMVTLEAADFEDLPLPSAKAIEIVQFIDIASIDPTYYNKAYFLEAEGPGVKPYVLLRSALADANKVGLVKVAVRTRETLALVRAKDEVLMLHTMLWPDELRDGEFAAPPTSVSASDAEVGMASMFIEQLSGDFEPAAFEDSYRTALEQVVTAKLEGVPLPTGEAADGPHEADVVDLVAALKASVEAAKKRREAAADSGKQGQGAGRTAKAG